MVLLCSHATGMQRIPVAMDAAQFVLRSRCPMDEQAKEVVNLEIKHYSTPAMSN